MTRRNVLLTVAVAALLVTAGCLGGSSGTDTQSPTGTDGATATDPGDEDAAPGGGGGAGDASMSFYVSDRPGAIEDFEHLNVTITKVGLHRSGDAGGEEATDGESEADDESPADGMTSQSESTTTETASDGTTEMTAEEPAETSVQSATETSADAAVYAKETTTTENGTETETESEGGADDESEDGWTTYEVDSRTVDLTELQGANASKLASFSVQSGEYDGVFVYVSDVEGTLKNGEQVNVKLPSGKLKINKGFTVQSGTETEFVFDIMIHEAGKSGKYVLRPVIGESGTGDQVDIRDVGEGDESGDGAGETETDEESTVTEAPTTETDTTTTTTDAPETDTSTTTEAPETETETQTQTETETDEPRGDLSVQVQEPVTAGEAATVMVSETGGPVGGATVLVDGEEVGKTSDGGTLEFTVPKDTDSITVAVTKDSAEAEVEVEVERGNGNNIRQYSVTSAAV
ncbi:DUF4382 domain-containing protein [Haloarchaeobius sp. DFWS5]|uniref:DUF4382 domain-containing protein n=1 Tax=Haloarchaeobius sp. DFWS5 TaxID=3446114 RepID=UPI003EBDCFE3